jgi:amino acid transporter
LLLILAFVKVLKKKDSLSTLLNGKWMLTWLAIGIFTLMDELTSIYYAPFEAYRFIGLKAIIYIALTSILIRFLSTRMVEIAEILEVNKVKGGGVYSFSYLTLGPTFSFIAISSIIVDYVLTAVISTVSAVENGAAFLNAGPEVKFFLKLAVIWFIVGLNIIGIKENAKFTFYIFIFAAFVLANLLLGGVFNLDYYSFEVVKFGADAFVHDFTGGSIVKGYENLIVGIGSCILAYSGIESVLQTASLVKNWKEIRKAYKFLALTVGIITPLIALFALSAHIKLDGHETDLIPYFAQMVNGKLFGIIVSVLACLTLIMAVNTAAMASGELIEKAAEKYNFSWITASNKRQSLYRIHVANGIIYTIILVVTSGNQSLLAEMYAIGLVASFCLNMISLLVYKFSKGTTEITYKTSKAGTLILFVILSSAFFYLCFSRPYGSLLWFLTTILFILGGWKISKTRAPEIPMRKATHNPMDVVFAVSEIENDTAHIYFQRPAEIARHIDMGNAVFVSFYLPRTEKPESAVKNHFWISMERRINLINMIHALLKTIEYEIGTEKKITVHFGWPQSSWMDRLSIGFMIHSLMRMPKDFPSFSFQMSIFGNPSINASDGKY